MKRKSEPRRRMTGPIHARIATLREQKKMSQEDLAVAAGVDNTAVSHWENGVSRPDVMRLPRVADALGVTVLELIAGEKAFAMLGQMIEDKAS